MAILLMLLASISFTSMSALVKALGSEVPLVQLVFLRCLLAAPILLIMVRASGRPLIVAAWKAIIIRTLLGMSAMFCFFYALTHMPLADCTFIGRTQPLIIALLAPMVLGENTPRAAWFAIGTGLAGVALIMKPAMSWPTAAWVALAAAALSAGAHLMVRRLNRTDYPLVIVFNFTVLSSIFAGIATLPVFVPLSGRQWSYVTGIAIFASLGQFLMTSAYRRDRAPAVAAAGYASVLFSIFYGYLFWNELPHPLAWAGGGLIVGGGLLLLVARWRSSETASPT